ncbi:MAG TPA: PhnD/SsuA/transferrin family substrate-binding protein, partial [Dissulfurispiraceae bacterium]|nr:PhnD/SsuA/transferrin family substrate-binding protein [Dissulfurispiraceae bacterium]
TNEYYKIKDKVEASLGFGHVISGKRTSKYLLLGTADSAATGIKDLKGKKISVIKGDDIAMIYLNTVLLSSGLPEAKRYFADVSLTRKPSQAVLDVFFGRSDGAVVLESSFDTIAELNPQIKQKLKILSMSPGLIAGINIFRKDLSDSYKEKVFQYGAKLGENPRGRQILTLFKLDAVYRLKEEDLNPTMDFIARYERLKTGRR